MGGGFTWFDARSSPVPARGPPRGGGEGGSASSLFPFSPKSPASELNPPPPGKRRPGWVCFFRRERPQLLFRNHSPIVMCTAQPWPCPPPPEVSGREPERTLAPKDAGEMARENCLGRPKANPSHCDAPPPGVAERKSLTREPDAAASRKGPSWDCGGRRDQDEPWYNAPPVHPVQPHPAARGQLVRAHRVTPDGSPPFPLCCPPSLRSNSPELKRNPGGGGDRVGSPRIAHPWAIYSSMCMCRPLASGCVLECLSRGLPPIVLHFCIFFILPFRFLGGHFVQTNFSTFR